MLLYLCLYLDLLLYSLFICEVVLFSKFYDFFYSTCYHFQYSSHFLFLFSSSDVHQSYRLIDFHAIVINSLSIITLYMPYAVSIHSSSVLSRSSISRSLSVLGVTNQSGTHSSAEGYLSTAFPIILQVLKLHKLGTTSSIKG